MIYFDNHVKLKTIIRSPSYHPNASSLHQPPAISEGHLRVGPLVGVPAMLREFGIDPADTIRNIGLNPELFDDPDHIIFFTTAGRLLKACAVQTQCPHFGLLVGQRAGPTSLGLVGHLLLHAPDVGSALRDLVLYLHLHDRGAVPELAVEQNLAVLSYAIYQQGVEGTDQICDVAIAIGFNLLRALCGPTWFPTEALFSHRRPRDAGPYRHFFQVPLRFDREQTALVFPAAWLHHPAPGADPVMHRRLAQQITERERLDSGDLIGPLRRVLRVLLLTRHSTLEQVASLFSMHSRTLDRRLAARGTTLRALVDEVRYEIARQWLENTEMTVGQIATNLHYSEASAFNHAFRRWSGISPTTWRTQRLNEKTSSCTPLPPQLPSPTSTSL